MKEVRKEGRDRTVWHTCASLASCARGNARAANGIVVGCSPPRVERWGMLVHQGGGWLIDRTRFSTRPAEPRHSFHPEPADSLGRTYSPLESQSKDYRETKSEGTSKRASRWNHCVSKGKLARRISFTLDTELSRIRVKTNSEIRANVITNAFYRPSLLIHSYR